MGYVFADLKVSSCQFYKYPNKVISNYSKVADWQETLNCRIFERSLAVSSCHAQMLLVQELTGPKLAKN